MRQQGILKIEERIQAGDVFLFKFKCIDCKTEHLLTYPITIVNCCGFDYSFYELDILHKRLIAGTRRLWRISKKTILALKEIYGDRCAYCLCETNGNYHVEHIVPLIAGGGNTVENLCLACRTCNFVAGRKIFGTFEGKRTYILERRKAIKSYNQI